MSTTENSRWERRTWPEIKRLAEEVPEAGIHFQSKARIVSAPDWLALQDTAISVTGDDPWSSSIES